jgi:magnesium transporter
MWVTGVIINIFGSLSVNLSTNLIKLAHNKNYKAASEHGPCPKFSKSPRGWWRFPGSGNKLWLFAIILFAIANIANFASFAFAAQSLLSALGSVQFISNVAFSKFVNKEKISRFVLAGTLVIVAGCVLLVSFGNHESPTYTAAELQELYKHPGIIIYLSTGAVVAITAYIIYKIGKRQVGGLRGQPLSGPWSRWLPICYALFSGIPGTLSVLYGKSMSLLLRSTFGAGRDSQFDNWYTYMTFVLFAIAALFWMTRFNKVRNKKTSVVDFFLNAKK